MTGGQPCFKPAMPKRLRIDGSRRPVVELAGMRFGHLLVIERVEKPTTNSLRRMVGAWWCCSCNCGAEVILSGVRIRQGTWTCRRHR
jgi:hypothetical protein